MTEQEQADMAELPDDDLIEIHDPEINPQALMAEIRRRIQRRREELGYDERKFPTFGATVACPDPPDDLPYPPELYHHLRQANESYAEVQTNPILAPSPATQVPILGRIWRLIRDQAHGLVLFYVNRSVAHEVNINRHLISVLNELTIQNQELQRRTEDLESQLKRRGDD